MVDTRKRGEGLRVASAAKHRRDLRRKKQHMVLNQRLLSACPSDGTGFDYLAPGGNEVGCWIRGVLQGVIRG